MTTTPALAFGSLLLASLAAFTLSAAPNSSFIAQIRGDVTAELSGKAVFGTAAGEDGNPTAFAISLGGRNAQGSIFFSRASGDRLRPGTYAVSDAEDGADEIRALVTTGSTERPAGVFQGRTGILVITSASDSVIRGSFQIAAAGFLAAEPAREDRPVTVAGAFTAVGH